MEKRRLDAIEKSPDLPEILVRVHKFESESEVLDWQLAENLFGQKSDGFKALYDERKKERGESKTNT